MRDSISEEPPSYPTRVAAAASIEAAAVSGASAKGTVRAAQLDPNAPVSTSALEIAFERPIVRRGLICSAVVGTLLITINHGDAILAGDVTTDRVLRMALTVVVPYVVSVVSSVGAIRSTRVRAATSDTRSR